MQNITTVTMGIYRLRTWIKLPATLITSLLIFLAFIRTVIINSNELRSPEAAYLKEACTLPKTPVMPKYFSDSWKPRSYEHDCSYEKRLTNITNEKELKLLWNPKEKNSTCCLREVIRMRRDTSYIFSTCLPLPPKLHLKHQEAFLIQCNEYLNIEASISDLPQVKKKQKYWAEIPPDNHPYSVLLLGIDTVSRSHMYRSAPGVIKLMKEMGFKEFDSFHSVSPSTMSNFNAALMGLTTEEVSRTCAPDWSSPFDDCPLIWNNYSDQNYVTGFIEDGFQTFNWGGQSGFDKEPTDYYFPQLFQVLTHFRERQFKKNKALKNSALECASTEPTPEFQWRYTLRFLKKFEDNPYFFFSYSSNPFHKEPYALYRFASPFENFLHTLKSHKKTMENTVIIFFTDHGDRHGFFNSDSVSSYYERVNPALFIRLPNKLKPQPQLQHALTQNSNKFVTPFDIHETLLHILALKKLPGPESMKNVSDARSSLLLELNAERTCSNTNIPKEHCICNALYPEPKGKDQTDTNEGVKLFLLNFAVQELNDKVKRSSFRDKCQDWSSSVKMIRWLKMINRNGTTGESEYVISFRATPKPARFDGRIKVSWDREKREASQFELVGLTRSNEYGKQSWCIRGKSHEDKDMRQFCYCKSKKELEALINVKQQ